MTEHVFRAEDPVYLMNEDGSETRGVVHEVDHAGRRCQLEVDDGLDWYPADRLRPLTVDERIEDLMGWGFRDLAEHAAELEAELESRREWWQ